MPPRNVRRRKKRAGRRKRAYLRNRSATSQALQINRLSGKILRIQNRLNVGNRFNYYNDGRKNVPHTTSVMGYGYTVLRIHPHTSSWLKCLDQPTGAQMTDDEWRLHKSQCHFRFEIASENTNPIEFTAFVVQVRRAYRDIVYYNWGADLEGMFSPTIPGTQTPVSTNFAPFNTFDSGQVFINQKIFKVLKAKKFTLGEVGYGTSAPPVRNIGDTVHHMYWTQRYGGKRGLKLGRPSGEIDDALDASNKTINRNCWTWLLIVNNDNILDAGTPLVKYTCLHTLSTSD